MQLQRPKRAPLILAGLVLAVVCSLRFANPDFFDRAERMTYDLRVRQALNHPVPVATNFAFVSLEDSSIAAVNQGKVGNLKLGYSSGLYWQRHIYGRLVNELAIQGASSIAFDVLFAERRTDHPPVQLADGNLVESDEYFALQTRRAGNVLLAQTPEVSPPDLFATNALALGDISTEKDSDGILRRVRAFRDVRRWHPLFDQLAAMPEIAADLSRAKLLPGKIVLPQIGVTNEIEIAVDAQNRFQLADFLGDSVPPGMPTSAPAFTERRIWHLGVVMAAQALKLNLATAQVNLSRGEILLSGPTGVERVLPVDREGFFYVDWRLSAADQRMVRAPVESLLAQDRLRLLGRTNGLQNFFQGKLVVIGSAAQGNDLTDRGATPLERNTLLVSKHWNVANSIITGNFIRRTSLALDLNIILLLGALTAWITWQLRAVAASLSVLLLLFAYGGGAVLAFTYLGWWLPVVYPLGGAVLALHGIMLVHLVLFEEQDKRRVKSVFSKMISPEIVNELLRAEKLALGGAHREVTVFFADVRGFTTLTDQMQEAAAEYIRTHQLDELAAEKFFEESARETLETVNLYLAAVAEAVKTNGGTLDKYIGDCVMAFWNAPTPNPQHAVDAVRAAIAAQRAIMELNLKREAENPVRQAENQSRISAGLPPRPLHSALQLGTGINSGLVTVGLMGSEEHGFNYTVFGREVNLASRLEGVSGSGRIIISDLTYFQLLRHAPELASTCNELFPVTVKGIKDAVRIYEVPWK